MSVECVSYLCDDSVVVFVIVVVCVFFFQAEDGIRDLVRSRGLGDVYKRQVQAKGGYLWLLAEDEDKKIGRTVDSLPVEGDPKAVSYTHLTLPTSDLV